jgi:hypothetical protein
MKNLKNIMIFLIANLFLNLQILTCQEGQNETSYKDIYITDYLDFESKLRLNKSADGIDKVAYSSIDGDPYIYRDFVTGKLILRTGEILQIDLRYDTYSDQIQFKDKDQIFKVINENNLALVVIDTIMFQYCMYQKSKDDQTSVENSWFILQKNGKCNLLIKKNVRLQAAELPKAYQEAKPAKFIHIADTYYLKKESKNAVRVSGKKDLLSILSDKEKEVSEYIKTNKLGVKDLDDLVKIISFYNSL